jgi:uncharacterized alpha-E superfamily protein
MLSRVAENLYWLGRYIERAENVARIIDVNYNLMLDAAAVPVEKQWQPLVVTSGDDEDFESRYKKYSEKSVLKFLIFDEVNPNSIWSCISGARFNARTVREAISPEIFNEINELYHELNLIREKKLSTEKVKDICERVTRFSHMIIGLTERTMLQDEGWSFIRLGRMLERGDKITRILDIKYFIILPSVGYVNTPYDDIQWAALLKSASALMPYRKKYNMIEYNKIIDFLVLEKTFPRSVKYSVNRAFEMLNEIDQSRGSKSLSKLSNLNQELDATTVEQINKFGLHEYLDLIQQKLNEIGGDIYDDFFFLSFT